MFITKKLTFRAVSELTGLLLNAVSMIYVSRVVGPEYIGFSATTSAITLLISRLADGGLTSLATQKLARDDEKLSSLLSKIVPPKLILSVLLILSLLGVVGFLPIDSTLKYFVTISSGLIFFETCSPSWAFIALGRINVPSVIRIIQSLSYALAVLCFVRTPGDWKQLPYLTLFNSAISFIMAVLLLWHFKLFAFDRAVFHCNYLRTIKDLYKDGIHFLKADLSGYIYTTSDRLILYYFTNPHTVGLYEAAYKIINPFYSINGVITPTMLRDLAQSFKHDRLRPVMAKYVFTMSLLTIPLGFFLLCFSDVTVKLLYGPRFVDSVPSLMILGFVITFGFTSGIIAQPFTVWNMQREFGNSVFWGNALNTALNFSLIPLWGAVGAAVATLAAKLIVTVVGYFYFRKATDYHIVKDFVWFFVASVIPPMLIQLLSGLHLNLYFLMALFICSYLVIVMVAYKKHFQQAMVVGTGVVSI